MTRMQKLLSRRDRVGDDGFTLIELMIVVTIIGIISAIAIPKYLHYVRSSQTAEVGQTAGIIVSAMRAYMDAQGLSPSAANTTFNNFYLATNTDTKPTGATTDLTTILPQLALPSTSNFNYAVTATQATDNGTDAQFCITAYSRTYTGAVVLYSSMPALASNTAWQGRMYTQNFTNSTTPVAGGYCAAYTAGAPAPTVSTQG